MQPSFLHLWAGAGSCCLSTLTGRRFVTGAVLDPARSAGCGHGSVVLAVKETHEKLSQNHSVNGIGIHFLFFFLLKQEVKAYIIEVYTKLKRC